MVVNGTADDIVYAPLVSGISANYLKSSIWNAGLDPENLLQTIP
ncbi:hypothetical protein [Mesorhizobium sp. 113-3-3]|nr:hypothetical protein [Mesorhizobium sp. 113-3-3]BCG82222.1 hypothetical protein MesoLj113b_57640 [Mesorhizobium sp. 113-3-3]